MYLAAAFISVILVGLSPSLAGAQGLATEQPASSGPVVADHVILFVLGKIDGQSLKTEPMPILSCLAAEGAATGSAQTIACSQPLPAITSLLKGPPIDKHCITLGPRQQQTDSPAIYLSIGKAIP